MSTHLRDQLWWRRERALVYPSGVDENKFLPEPQAAARRKLGWPPGGRVALFNAGGSCWIKRPDLAQAAVERARTTLPELRLELLDGSVDPELVPLLMNASDCLLLTSEIEGSPTVVQEALACNLPIVAFKVGDTEEMLKGVPGTLLVERDIDCISRALIELAGGGKRSEGRRKIGQFSEARIAQAISAVYRDLS